MTDQVQRKYLCLRDKKDPRDYRYNAPRRVKIHMPYVVDNFLGLNLTPYDQGSLGSCTSQATAMAYRFARIKQKLSPWMPSRLFHYYNERLLEGTVDEDAGASLRDAMKTGAAQGICPEDEWPYDIKKFAALPPMLCYDHALEHQIDMYQSVHGTLEQMFGCLAEGFPFVCGIQVYKSFDDLAVHKSGDVQMPHKGWSRWNFGGEPLLGGHAILVYGYSQPKKVFYWINSYGLLWGKEGRGTIPIEYLLDEGLCHDRWTIRLTEPNL